VSGGMTRRIFIENPPPFKQAPRGPDPTLVDVPIGEGLDIVRHYLDAKLSVAGFHHADLDRYEALQLRHEIPPARYDAFDYAEFLKRALPDFAGHFIPHHVVVYETATRQAPYFKTLLDKGIREVVLVGKPFSLAPEGIRYECTVEEVLGYLAHNTATQALRLGVIGIHTRRGEAARIAEKYCAAGRRLRVMGQFLDAVEPMSAFMDELAREFARRKLTFEGLEWNVGLAIFSLENRAFYAKLLRQERLRCEERLVGLKSIDERMKRSNELNLAFAQRLDDRARALGIKLGYSLQPIIERYLDGRIHPAIGGAVDLARALSES
jgi:hypothetical protein